MPGISMAITERRQNLKDALILAAERVIETRGVAGLKARDLAADAGCSLGAIYNVFADLDALILTVNAKTLAALERELDAAVTPPPDDGGDPEWALAQMDRLAMVYLDFAAANTARWRAMFDHTIRDKSDVPEWYYAQRKRLFVFIEQPLRALKPELEKEALVQLARTVFSAVHGVILLGLEEKLGETPLSELRSQTSAIVAAIGKGLAEAGKRRETDAQTARNRI
jgi:AcrR family transcriptional regulator